MATARLAIRQIGDPILHTPPPPVDFDQAGRLDEYSAILQNAQCSTGGVGIACNQSAAIAAPVAIFWAGTDDEAVREAARLRYPDATLPPAILMINPEILSYGAETYFPESGEGCLSVAGPIRGKVRRHRTVRVRYQTQDGMVQERECTGFEAHIVQHEHDHLRGVVFLQRIFADCSAEQQSAIARLLQEEAARRQAGGRVETGIEPIMVFDRDGESVVFDPTRLAQALGEVPDATLLGMQSILAVRLR
ncbi:peptide deformylase [Paludibacterium purpuratum]|uniref:Peptide deformylase n=1 Tax=Paludibacterium purpuratum TaxID=1144873 RepID=A0A4R7B7M2_9NEIS|nr:peptide deformylase [Paludibacterium purpuratum]TDR80711.1 peptide deformylase [Paludibacterium purpuratum]